ncbi:MAG TPA: tetratricopeptide repeat protein [Gemmataceae bacterium]|nr:tetratricopeptide repeat protein [Gemmataceae bacterium]
MIAGDINNVNANRWAQNNRAGVRPVWGNPANWNRPWYGNRPAWYWGRAWYGRHWAWHHGYWNYWRTPPGVWFGAAMAIGWLSAPADTVVYENPYWVPYPETTMTPVYVDYAQPIPAPTQEQTVAAFPPSPDQTTLDAGGALPTTDPPVPAANDAATEATKLFVAARESFKAGKYADAQDKVDQAIKALPSDATLHEFRSLTLFARQRYKDAAAGLYAVLAAGPGWDWETMKTLYGTEETYTQHLRTLEEFVTANPKAGYGHFLLAYHYLVLGNKDAAVNQFEEVVKVEPADKLSAALIKALTTEAK